MSKNDIKVHVDNDVVTVSVEKADKRDEDKEEQGVRCDSVAWLPTSLGTHFPVMNATWFGSDICCLCP